MNWEQHYDEAERLLKGVKQNPEPTTPAEAALDRNTVLAALTHATLAAIKVTEA